jgi:hypothetical protein
MSPTLPGHDTWCGLLSWHIILDLKEACPNISVVWTATGKIWSTYGQLLNLVHRMENEYVYIYMIRIITDLMYCLSSVYWVIATLHVSGASAANHQKVECIYIYGKWYLLYFWVDSQRAWWQSTQKYSAFGKSLCTYKWCWKLWPWESIQAWTRSISSSKSTNCIALRFRCFRGIFQQIALALNRCIYCLLERRIQQEKYVPQLKEP